MAKARRESKKIRRNHRFESLNKSLIFASVFGLSFAFDRTIVDKVYLPKVLLFGVILLLFLIVNRERAIGIFKDSKPLQFFGLFLLFLLISKQSSATWYLGESQRVNGLFFFVCAFLSLVSGALIWQLNLSRQLLRSLVGAGTLSSILVILSRHIDQKNSFEFGGWLTNQTSGGINDNFKSMFIAVCLLALLLLLGESRTKFKVIIVSGVFAHLTALILIGNLQGFALIFLSVFIHQILVHGHSKLLIPVTIVALGMYSFIVWRPPKLLIQDSSIHERLLLAKKAFEYLENSTILRPDFVRVSSLDFSSAKLTTDPVVEFWIDDVHNFYLQLANTIGVWPTLAFIAIFVATIRLALRMNVQAEHRVLKIGIVSICTSYGITLAITMGTMFYAFVFLQLFGVLVGMAFGERAESELKVPGSNPRKKSARVFAQLTYGASALSAISISLASVSFVAVDYASQNKFMVALKQYSSEEFNLVGWETERSSLERSNDLRFLYEVSRFLTNSSVCEPAKEVATIMKKKAPRHFLTREAETFSASCVPSP